MADISLDDLIQKDRENRKKHVHEKKLGPKTKKVSIM